MCKVGEWMELTHRKYLAVTLPFVISSIAVPVIGAVDTAVVGRLGSPDYISAVALGAVIFSTIYWLLGFLRITTAGMTAQAVGRQDNQEVFYILLRALVMATAIGIFLLICRKAIFNTALLILQPEVNIAELVRQYFEILVWGFVPFLLYQVLAGWITGILHIKIIVAVELGISLLNFILDIVLVNVWHLSVQGVAYAFLLAQVAGFILAVLFFFWQRQYLTSVNLHSLFAKNACLKLTSCCTHLLIRTLCMLMMVNIFMSESAAMGGSILAANSILFQIQYIMGDVFAGMSQTAALYAGIAVGSGNSKLFKDNLKLSGFWSLFVGFVMSLGYYLLRESVLYFFTDLSDVLSTAYEVDIYIMLFPVISALGIVYYGIFNGALVTAPICYSMLLTGASFLATKIALVPVFGNTGLWQAFLIFYIARTSFLLIFIPYLCRKTLYNIKSSNG